MSLKGNDGLPSRVHMGASLFLGAVGLLVLGVQPLLYGAYVNAGQITEARLGTLAAVEIAAIAFGSTCGIAALRHASPRIVGALGVLLLAGANLVPDAGWLILSRAAAGFGGGLVVAVAAAAIAITSNVNAAAAAFLFLQAASQYAILQFFSLGTFGSSPAQIQTGLAILALASLLLFPWIIARPILLAEGQKGSHLPPLSGWLALSASSLFVGSAVGIWAYFGLWLEGRGVEASHISQMLTASMAGQMAGALIAMTIGTTRHSTLQLCLTAMTMICLVLFLLLFGPSGWHGWVLTIGYGVAWMVGTPALSGLVLDVDASRNSLPFAASAQLLGAALLPTFAGETLASVGIDQIFRFCIGTLVLSLVLIGVARLKTQF